MIEHILLRTLTFLLIKNIKYKLNIFKLNKIRKIVFNVN